VVELTSRRNLFRDTFLASDCQLRMGAMNTLRGLLVSPLGRLNKRKQSIR
jgi:hypothetical protein